MIEVKNLVKRYGDHTAVNGISFTVERGKIYGLLGPNGAGKSTTMNIITGCLAATQGSVTINGHDIFEEPGKAKRCIGYLPENPPLYTEMTPVEYLTFVAEAKKVKGDHIFHQVKEVMEITGLDVFANRLIKNLSKGYRQRVGIAQAMLGDPDIIILDEPTVGLDPKQILEIRELIRRLGETKTVILSSHILAEISAVCDHVMIISHGNLVANDSLEKLESIVNRADKLELVVKGNPKEIANKLTGLCGVISCEYEEDKDYTETGNPAGTTFELELTKDSDVRDDIFFAMADMRCPIVSMQYERTTLEDIFLALTEDNIEPDENGNIPSVEEILYNKGAKKYPFADTLSPEDEKEDNDECGSNEEEASEKDESTNDDDYKPLFGGNN